MLHMRLTQPGELPTSAMLEAGALALTQCGLHGSRDSLKATADSVWRAMEEARQQDDYEPEEDDESAVR